MSGGRCPMANPAPASNARRGGEAARESRLWLYNKVVGATGLITLTGVLAVHPDRSDLFCAGAGDRRAAHAREPDLRRPVTGFAIRERAACARAGPLPSRR